MNSPQFETRERPAQVQWDRKNSQAILYREEGWARAVPTGTQKLPDAELEWLPLEDEFPDDFLPQFHQLLGARSTFTLAPSGDYVIRRWPDADFSEEKVRELVGFNVMQQIDGALHLTDTFVMEALEEGVDLDPEVKQHRKELRDKRDALVTDSQERPIDEVMSMEFDPEPVRRNAVSVHQKKAKERIEKKRGGNKGGNKGGGKNQGKGKK